MKPGPGAKWLEFWTRDHNSGVDCKITSNRDADGTFKVGSDIESGKWNQVILDLTKTTSGLVQAKNLWVRTNDVSTWYYDEITSVYSPVHKLDLAKLVNGQTRLVNGELQFKPSGANTYDTTPTILGSQNQPGYSRTDTSQADFQAGAAEGVVADSSGALALQKQGTVYSDTVALNADFSGTQINTQPVNDSLKLVTGTSIDKSTPVDVATGTHYSNYMNIGYNNGRKIARDKNGNLYVVYVSGDLIYCKKSTDNGSTWTDTGFPLISGYSQSNPSIAIDSHNNVHVVWHGTDAIYGGSQIKYSKYDGTSWSTWTNIQPISGYSQSHPSIAIDSADNLHVIWQGGDSSNTTAAQIKYSKFTTTWSPWVNISEVSGYSQSSPTQDGGKLYLLDLLTGANTLLSSNVPREIKPNHAGSKAVFKGTDNSLYLYDRSTGTTTTISASAVDFEIQDDGTVYYTRSDSTNFYRLAPSASPPGEICLTSQTVSCLDVPKTGNQAFFSDTSQLFKLTLTPAGWKSSVLTTAAKDITGLWANSGGSLLFFKTDDGLFCYQVSSKSARKLDVTASSVIRVTKDNQLVVLGPNYEYLLYDGNTDSTKDIRPSSAAANYTFVVDNTGAKMAYVAAGGLLTNYYNGAQGPERYLLSFDGKGSWYSYKSGQWELVTGSTPTAEQFQEQGMTKDDINALTEADFDKLYRDGREIYSLDVAIYFASVDPFTTPSLKSIIVSLKGSLDSGNLAGTMLQKPLYAQKQQDFNATGWRRIKRIYTVELYPREAETYYFISTDGKNYKSYQNMQWVTVDPQLFTKLETNWITLTQQGMTATALRSIPEDFLNQLLPAGNFSVAYIQKVQDASTQGYTSQVDVEYVGSEFTSPNLVLKVTLTDGTVKEYQNLTKAEVEDFMDWLSKRQYNRGPVFHKFRTGSPTQGVTQINDYLNYYLIQSVSVEELS